MDPKKKNDLLNLIEYLKEDKDQLIFSALSSALASSLIFFWFTTYNVAAVAWTGGSMALVAIWAWRYPGSVEEQKRRKKAGEKIAWLK